MAGENDLLQEFLLRLGDSLVEAAATAQRDYDTCNTLEEFHGVQIVRDVFTEQIPDVVSDIYLKLHEDMDTFNFWEWYSKKREVVVTQVVTLPGKETFFAKLWKYLTLGEINHE